MTEDGRVVTDETKRTVMANPSKASFNIALVAQSELELMKSQLAARDAALDAVLDWATNPKHSQCDSPEATALRAQVVELLAKHGVHPR